MMMMMRMLVVDIMESGKAAAMAAANTETDLSVWPLNVY